MKSVGSFSRTQQEILRQREAGALQQYINNSGRRCCLSIILRFISNGIAGAIGGIIVLYGSRASDCQEEHAGGESRSSERYHNAKFRDTGNKEVGGVESLDQVKENEQTIESILSDQHTNTGQETTSKPSLSGQPTS